MKLLISIILLVIVISSCNISARDNIAADDSLKYYPATPTQLSKEEFRDYYRRLSSFFDSTLLNGSFNGGILIAKDGAVIYEKYCGKIDLRKNDTLTANTALHIASTSKTFTGIAILRMVQEDKLSLNDTISKFFPGFPYQGITVKMLLTHRSGLPNYLYFMSNNKWGLDEKGKWNHQYARNEDVVNMMMEKKPDLTGRPDGRFNYCNTNYVLLAMIIEKLSGKSFPEYMQQKFFTPLQMHHTYVFTLKDTLTATASFTPSGNYWAYDFFDATYGDKNIYTTPQDLLKWDQALYTDQLIRTTLRDSAFVGYSFERPGVHNYGLGWRLQLLPNGKKVVYHFGKWHGFNAAFARLVDEKATIIILGNKFTRSIYSTAHKCYDIFGEYDQQQDDPEEADSAKNSFISAPAKKQLKKSRR
ncbi:MAG TPA: serine hydrolase domain-containing protein [Chitinophagaceae bacterium]|nr:serine hydrolase domain-containing protein [Chitinophagaceae bacterium]